MVTVLKDSQAHHRPGSYEISQVRLLVNPATQTYSPPLNHVQCPYMTITISGGRSGSPNTVNTGPYIYIYIYNHLKFGYGINYFPILFFPHIPTPNWVLSLHSSLSGNPGSAHRRVASCHWDALCRSRDQEGAEHLSAIPTATRPEAAKELL